MCRNSEHFLHFRMLFWISLRIRDLSPKIFFRAVVLNFFYRLEFSSYSHLISLFQFIKSPGLRPFSGPFKLNPGAGIQAALFWNPQVIPMESWVVSKWSAAMLQKYCEHREGGGKRESFCSEFSTVVAPGCSPDLCTAFQTPPGHRPRFQCQDLHELFISFCQSL